MADGKSDADKPAEIGKPLIDPADWPKAEEKGTNRSIVVPQCHLTVTIKAEIASKVDGQLVFLGVQDPTGTPEDSYPVPGLDGKPVKFKPLHKGAFVKKGQVVGILEDDQAKAEYDSARAKAEAAKDVLATHKDVVKTLDDVVALEQDATSKGAGTKDRLYQAKAQAAHAKAEMADRDGAHRVAVADLSKALNTLERHALRAKFSGEVVDIIKKPGEVVKAGETVLIMNNYDKLLIEGNVPAEEYDRVKTMVDQNAIVLAPELKTPAGQCSAHTYNRPITALALARIEGQAFAVSGSDDGMVVVRGWSNGGGTTKGTIWKVGAAVRAIACTRPGVEPPLAFVGSDDGKGRLYDLSAEDMKSPLRELADGHDGSVLAAAFSPDGGVAGDGRREDDPPVGRGDGQAEVLVPAGPPGGDHVADVHAAGASGVGRQGSGRVHLGSRREGCENR